MTLGELATLCISEHAGAVNTHGPSPWDRLLAELRDAGYLSPREDLARIVGGATVTELIRAGYLSVPQPPALLLRAPDRSKLDLPLPEDMVERIWALIKPFRYTADGGYLRATNATSAPYSSARAIDQFGMKLVVQASARDNMWRTPIPGRAVARRFDRVLRRAGPVPIVALSPVLAPFWVIGAARNATRDRRQTGVSRSSRRTGSDLNQLLIYAVGLAIPAVAVAAWFAIWASHLPPHGPAGRWIALGLAALFGAQNMIVLYLFTLGFAMDGSNEAQQPALHPVRYLFPRVGGVLMMMLMVNAPLALILLVIGLVT